MPGDLLSILVILLFVGLLIWRWRHLPSLDIPGQPVPPKDLGISTASHPSVTSGAIVNPGSIHDLKFLTEDVRAVPVDRTTWELHIFFTLYNLQSQEITVYDFHAEEYCQEGSGDYNLALVGREPVKLFSDNSIIRAGRLYRIPPRGSLSIDLGMKMSNDGARVTYAFALFVDAHYLADDIGVKKRYPSDSIYVAQIPSIKFVAVNERYVSEKLADPKTDVRTRRFIKKLMKYLAIHSGRLQVIS